MKFYFEPLNTPIILSDEYSSVLVIENQALFYNVCNSLYEQSNKCSGILILSDNEKVLDFAKSAEVILQFVPFESNKKSLITKLYKRISEDANAIFYDETSVVISELSRYIYKLIDEYNSDLEIDDVDVQGLLKLFNVKFSSDNSNLAEKLFSYCKNVVNLEGNKLFIFVGLRSYMTDDEFFSFTKTLIDHKIASLFVENVDRRVSCNEVKTVIDADLCVI